MAETPDPGSLLVQHLGRIQRVASSLCRRHGLSADDADEFTSWAVARLVRNDYAILRRFRGESEFTTYLTVVLRRMYRDFQVQELGRWRPSASAQRLGAVAVELEKLMRRDGYELAQAGEVLRSTGVTSMSDRELGNLLAGSPASTGRPKRAGDAPLELVPSTQSAEQRVHDQEAEALRARVRSALAGAIAGLPAEDQVILRMRFEEKQTVADISRTLGLEQKPLYRRLERLYAGLRPALERAGISREEVAEMLNEDEP